MRLSKKQRKLIELIQRNFPKYTLFKEKKGDFSFDGGWSKAKEARADFEDLKAMLVAARTGKFEVFRLLNGETLMEQLANDILGDGDEFLTWVNEHNLDASLEDVWFLVPYEKYVKEDSSYVLRLIK